MTVKELFDLVDQIRPNAFTEREKLHFLNTIEGKVYREILEKAEKGAEEFLPFREGDEERELAVPIPYTDIYIYYLAAMRDFDNGDAGRYNDTMVLSNTAWNDYAAYYREKHRPKQTNLFGMIPERS